MTKREKAIQFCEERASKYNRYSEMLQALESQPIDYDTLISYCPDDIELEITHSNNCDITCRDCWKIALGDIIQEEFPITPVLNKDTLSFMCKKCGHNEYVPMEKSKLVGLLGMHCPVCGEEPCENWLLLGVWEENNDK